MVELGSLTVDPEICEYIIPLGEEELFQLERNILSQGCLEPLAVWRRGNQSVIVDGHNRFKICEKHNIPYKVREVFFTDLEEVKVWMADNQMGRRNLTPDQMSYYRGLKYISLKKDKGGYDKVKSKGTEKISTSELLSAQFNVSESTIKRDAQYAEGLNNINKSNPKLKLSILTGEAKVRKADIRTLSRSQNLVIKNEADLYNKAKLLRQEILNEVENNLRQIQYAKVEDARQVLKDRDSIFATRKDRLKNIKGMVVSAINRAINEKDADAIKDLKKLIGQLEDLLFIES